MPTKKNKADKKLISIRKPISELTQKLFPTRAKKIIGGSIAVILILIAANFIFTSLQISDETTKMERHLEKKYGKDFTSKNARIESTTLGDPKRIVADFYPKENPNLIFRASKQIERAQDPEPYYDYYLVTLWNEQESKQLEELMNSVYGSRPTPRYIHNILAASEFVINFNEGKTISLEEARKKYNNSLTYYLRIDGDNANPIDLSVAAKDAFKVLGYMRTRQVDGLHLVYSIKAPTGKRYKCDLSGKDELAMVQSVDDISRCFKEEKL